MAFENTITEEELDPNTRNYLQGLGSANGDVEPDLAVDGLTDSILSRILGLFGVGRK